jgi:iron complex outermembrane receptor protein
MRYIGDVHRHFDRGSFESELFISKAEMFFDAAVQWRSPDEDLAVELWVKNLTDIDDYYVGGIPLVDFIGGGGQIFAEPRSYGLNVRYQFGVM